MSIAPRGGAAQAMDSVIFLEKVRRPDPRGLVRERLDRLASGAPLNAGPPPLRLVLGPPGSGKTTLLSHLAAGVDDAAAWYRVGTEDDDELALTRHLGYTLGAAMGAPGVIEAATSGRIADLVTTLDDPAVKPAQLIIDDLHEIAGTRAEAALESFLGLRPRKIRVTLGSRRPPNLNTSRMLVSGDLIQLDAEDLRFRSWEVEQLFRSVYGSPLSPEAASALTRRTGGWAAGLQLFQLATAQLSRLERERAVEELNGRTRLIRSYLARNVLGGLDPVRRRFLLLTSTLGVLTGDLCDALLQTTGSAAVLSELEREQFFTTSTDAGLTFRYHQVLQTHLEVVLVDELGAAAARRLYARSAELLEHAERPAAAIRAHARAEDWGAVARLLKRSAVPVGGDEALWGMLSLPGAPTDDPGLVLAGARRLARGGHIAESVAAYRQAEALLDDPEFRRRCTMERGAVAVWLPRASLPLLPAPEDRDADTNLLRLSVELRHLTYDVRSASGSQHPLVRGVAALLAGDEREAARQFRAGPDHPPGAPPGVAWEPLALRLAARVVDLLTEPDETAAGQLEEIVLSADVQGWPWLSRLARGLQSAMMLAAAPVPWRRSAASDLVEDFEQSGDRWSAGITTLAIGVVFAAIDQPDDALATLDRAAAAAGELSAPVLESWARVLRCYLATRQGLAGAEQQAALAVRQATGLGLSRAAAVAEAVTHRDRPNASHPPVDGSIVRAAEPGISIRCLGGFSLSAAGVELPWRTLRPRVRALLMLLAVHHGRSVHRERLVDALWPDATLASGIRSLQVAVSSIRQCLSAGGISEDALRRDGDAYALRLPEAFDQLAEFERLARTARRQPEPLTMRIAALEHYTGDLLPEVGAAEWVVEERVRLKLLAASVGLEAARDALAAGEAQRAHDLVRRSVSLDRCHDPSWELLITICLHLGDYSAAAVARREQAQMWDDLGVVPPSAASGATARRS